jgi:hypothetical protein
LRRRPREADKGPIQADPVPDCALAWRPAELAIYTLSLSKSRISVRSTWSLVGGAGDGGASCSLTRSRAGPIARSGAGSAFVEAVIDECTRVCDAEGYPTPPQMVEVARGIYSQSDSTYGPSLLVDIENGRPTEG